MPLELILPTSVERTPYLLRFGSITNPRPSEREKVFEMRKAAHRFIEDMAKQGWEWTGQAPQFLGGPQPAITDIKALPKKPERTTVRGPHAPGRDTGDVSYQVNLDDLDACDGWEWIYGMTFYRKGNGLRTEFVDTDWNVMMRNLQHGR